MFSNTTGNTTRKKMIFKIIKQDKGFVQVDRKVVEDKKISWKARGILFYLLSKPEDWQVFISQLNSASEKDGDTSLRNGMKELIDRGYIETKIVRDESKKFTRWLYFVFESLDAKDKSKAISGFSINGFPKSGKPHTTNIDITNKDINNKEKSNRVAYLKDFFLKRCKELRGFEPEITAGKDTRLLKLRLEKYSLEQLQDLIEKFFHSKVGGDLGYSVGVCFSTTTINLWLGNQLEKAKERTFRGNPMRDHFGKLEVLEQGDWKEFAGKESDIEYK